MATTTNRQWSDLFLAAVDLLGRTGAHSFRIGYSSDDDGPPIVFWASVTWSHGHGPIGAMLTQGQTVSEAAGAIDPERAVLRLAGQVIDGGSCFHCNRTAIFLDDPDDDWREYDGSTCPVFYHPSTKRFEQACQQGDHQP